MAACLDIDGPGKRRRSYRGAVDEDGCAGPIDADGQLGHAPLGVQQGLLERGTHLGLAVSGHEIEAELQVLDGRHPKLCTRLDEPEVACDVVGALLRERRAELLHRRRQVAALRRRARFGLEGRDAGVVRPCGRGREADDGEGERSDAPGAR